MSDQIIYDNNGSFACVLRTNPDGSQTSFGPGANLWNDYVALNGVPPATGAPTYPPAPLPTQVQNAISDFHSWKGLTAQQKVAVAGNAQMAALIDDLINALHYLNTQIQNS